MVAVGGGSVGPHRVVSDLAPSVPTHAGFGAFLSPSRDLQMPQPQAVGLTAGLPTEHDIALSTERRVMQVRVGREGPRRYAWLHRPLGPLQSLTSISSRMSQ